MRQYVRLYDLHLIYDQFEQYLLFISGITKWN